MKKYITILTFLIVSSFFVGCKNTDSAPKENSADTKKEIAVAKNPQTARLKIDGMTCQMGCAKAIEEQLVETKGVQKASVDFDKKEAIVNFDLDQLSTDQLKKIVESAADGQSYTVVNMKIEK